MQGYLQRFRPQGHQGMWVCSDMLETSENIEHSEPSH